MEVNENRTALEIMEEYRALRGYHHRINDAFIDHEHMVTLQRINSLHEQQKGDLVELRRCLQYILEHTNVIQNALRNAEDSQAAVPLCNTIVQDVLAVRTNIMETINNAKEIKKIMGSNYDPVMDNVLQKMEEQLSNWSNVLKIASRSLVNSRALVDNIQNLVVAQQQMCSEVVSSDLFSVIEDAEGNSESTSPPQGAESEEGQANNLSNNQLNASFMCSTPILNGHSEDSA